MAGICFLAFSLCHCDFTFKTLGLTCFYCRVCLVVRVTGEAETWPEPGDCCVNQRGGGRGRSGQREPAAEGEHLVCCLAERPCDVLRELTSAWESLLPRPSRRLGMRTTEVHLLSRHALRGLHRLRSVATALGTQAGCHCVQACVTLGILLTLSVLISSSVSRETSSTYLLELWGSR